MLGTYLGKTAPENPPIPLNSLFPDDSTSTDSDEDLAEELEEFFRFMIWNDLSGKEEKRKKKSQVLLKMKRRKALFLVRTSLLNSMIFMTSSLMILMMTDI